MALTKMVRTLVLLRLSSMSPELLEASSRWLGAVSPMDWCIGSSPARDPNSIFHAARLPLLNECPCSTTAMQTCSEQNVLQAY